MSGSSYNYLYCLSDCDNFIEYENELKNMIERLKDIPESDGASSTSQQILEMIIEYEKEITTRKNKIINEIHKVQDVWEAIEFYDSNDKSYEGITKAINRFNADHK